jgi:hypothetical protein
MIFEAVAGSLGKHLPPSGWPSSGLRPDHSHRREWPRRGLLSPKLVCPPRRTLLIWSRKENPCPPLAPARFVRQMSVITAMQRLTAARGETRRDSSKRAREAGNTQLTGCFRRWWQMLSSNQLLA